MADVKFYVQAVDWPQPDGSTKTELTVFTTPPSDLEAKRAAGAVLELKGQDGMTVEQIQTLIQAGRMTLAQAPTAVYGEVTVSEIAGIRGALGV
ncbi:MAG: hypothetical protein CMJ75_18555 [Planctomycetaceae bacterium]|nr:hypothetical protein [Planctomycetaceae bacterium]